MPNHHFEFTVYGMQEFADERTFEELETALKENPQVGIDLMDTQLQGILAIFHVLQMDVEQVAILERDGNRISIKGFE